MDLFTHILLGAIIGGLVASYKIGNKALIWGALCSLIPEIDTLIIPFLSTTKGLFFNQGITHSLLFYIVISPLLALLVRKCTVKLEYTLAQWTRFVFIILLSNSLLDVFTIYGVGLLEPLYDKKFALSSIAKFDMFFTIPLLIFVIIILRIKQLRHKSIISWLGTVLLVLYISFTFLNKLYIQSQFENKLRDKDIRFEKTEIFPIIGSNFLWNCVAQDRDGFWVCYETNLSKHNFELELFMRNDYYAFDFEDDERFQDLQKITKGYFVLEKYDNGDVLLHDLRFGRFGFKHNSPFMESFTIRNEGGLINYIEKNKVPYFSLISDKFGIQ